MKNLFILGNGFDIDLGLNTTFKAFRESFEFQSIADIPLIKKIKDYQWNDIEGKLREELIAYSKNPSEEYAKSINDAWLMLTKHWGIYLPELTDLDKININKESCAYQLLMADEGHDSHWYTFNYTNPWYLCNLQDKTNLVFMHNQNTPLDWAIHHRLCHFTPTNLIFGVDSSVPSCIKNNEILSHIIKINNPHFNMERKHNLHQALNEVNNVIIFGQSFGITDSDYFKPYFEAIIDKNIQRQNLYFVTYNKASQNNIIQNMKQYGINFDHILKSNININIIYT